MRKKSNSSVSRNGIFATMVATEAIVIRNARKRYGKVQVLDGLNLTVSRGSIYGLLGASGCGKTTLLSCVVGVRHLDSGEIWVLGGKPGSKGSGIPGPRVGYMPQEISLVQEFTVIGALYYFGRINGLEDHEIEERHAELADLFQLPPENRMVKDMSGGQQRRVSFAAALIHKPELLILDEPTVGLDPVLREKIWDFLVKQTQEEGVTVIITTHYIDETKLANCIGLMRCGQLLAESSPSQLLARFQCETLEEAFLTLSQQQNDNQARGVANLPSVVVENEMDIETPDIHSVPTEEAQCINDYNRNRLQRKHEVQIKPAWYLACRRFQALMVKNFLQFLRHPGGLLFAFVLPLVQVLAFFGALGGDPNSVHIGIVNEEAGNCSFGSNRGTVIYEANGTCDFIDLSCRFLYGFNDSIARKSYFNTLPEAYEAVKNGKASATMYFSKNFSSALQNRLEDIMAAKTVDIVNGQIQVWLDMGDRQIGFYLEKKLFERFFEVYKEIITECKITPKFAETPMRFEDPIFGSKQQNYITFVIPGFLLSVVFFLATSVSCSIIITDRFEGVWDRSLVQGVNTAEILVAHILTQVTAIIIQVAVTVCVCFVLFNVHCKGSLTIVVFLILLTAVCGMCYGFFISVVCGSHTMANYLSTGSFYPMILLCGCIWPIEGMPTVIYWISCMVPTTIPGVSIRAVMEKGYSVNNPEVFQGFLSVSGWIVCLFTFCLIRLKSKHG